VDRFEVIHVSRNDFSGAQDSPSELPNWLDGQIEEHDIVRYCRLLPSKTTQVPNDTAELPGPPARTLKLENPNGGPGQLQPLIRRGFSVLRAPAA
jgi:hypothetical protein